MTEQEKQLIKNEIYDEIATQSLLVEQLEEEIHLSDDDLFEINGGRSVSFSTIKKHIDHPKVGIPEPTYPSTSGDGHSHANKELLDSLALDSNGHLSTTTVDDEGNTQYTPYLQKSIFDDLFEKVVISEGRYAIRAKYDLYSDGDITALGRSILPGGSSGGTGVAMYFGDWTDWSEEYDTYAVSGKSGKALYDLIKNGGGSVDASQLGALTITRNGVAAGVYNPAKASTIDIVVPTRLSELVDDKGLLGRTEADSLYQPKGSYLTETQAEGLFVKKSGDVMTGALNFSLDNILIRAIYNSAGNYSNVLYVKRSDAAVIYGSPQWAKVILETSGSCAYRQTSGVMHKIWDSGNDGHGSTLDADLLDGVHGSGYFRRYGNLSSGTAGGTNWRDSLSKEVGAHNGHESNIGNISLYNTEYSQLLLQDVDGGIAFIRTKHWSSGWGAWQQLARITDNVASATKLADNAAYTAWGQTFFVNGKPQNVSGDMSGVGTITRSNASAVDEDVYGNLRFKSATATSWHIDNTSGSPLFSFLASGNFGIGISPSYKLDVNGTARVTALIINAGLIEWDAAKNAFKFNGNLYATGDITALGATASGGSGSSGGVDTLAQLTDVSLSGLAAGHALVYDGTKWVNRSVASAGLDLSGLAQYLSTNQYLTQPTADGRYVTLATEQTISGKKWFNAGTWNAQGNESNEITSRIMNNGTIRNGSTNNLAAIRNAIDFRWYDTHWVIGNVRSSNTSSDGFGIGVLQADGKVDLGCLINYSGITAGCFVRRNGTASQFLMADGSVTTKKVRNNVGTLDWTDTVNGDVTIPTISLLAYWNGCYTGTGSNLQYCDRGRFGDIVTHSHSEYVTALGTNGNYLTWTKNGVINNITVPYATNADTVDGKHADDFIYHRRAGTDIDNLPTLGGGLYEIPSATGTLPFAGTWHKVFDWGTSDPNYRVQLATGYTQDFGLFLRHKIAGNWQPWRTILDSGNYSSILDSRYVNITGDTMTGPLIINSTFTVSTAKGNITINTTTDDFFGPGAAASNVFRLGRPDGRWANVYATTINVTSSALVSNLNADLLDGRHAEGFSWRKALGGQADSRGAYVILSHAYNGTILGGSLFMGTVYITRGGSGSWNGKTAVMVQCGGQYNNNIANYQVLNSSVSIAGLYKIVYNGTAYIALKMGATSTMYFTVEGLWSGIDPILVNDNDAGVTSEVLLTNTPSMVVNASSATKWQTARKFWGQSADGTADVSGSMSNVGDIGSSGGSYGCYQIYRGRATGEAMRIEPCDASGNWLANCITMGTNGNVVIGGVGTTSYKLDVNGDIIASGWLRTRGTQGWYSETYGGGWHMTDNVWLKVYNNKNIYQGTGIIRTDGEFQLGDSGSKFRVTSAGNLVAAGDITALGTLSQSDMRLKNVIRDFLLNIDSIANAPLFIHTWKDREPIEYAGTSAQYWQQVLPQVVRGTDRLALDYGKTALASVISVAKETVGIKEEIKRLRQRIQHLESINNIIH